MRKIGILGVGELTEKIVKGLLRADSNQEVFLSPRGAERALSLAASSSCTVMESNQAVVDRAEIILVGVRPESLAELAGDITLHHGQIVVSLVAGVSSSTLESTFQHKNIVRMMLTYAAEINKTTVVLSRNEIVLIHQFSCLGDVLVIADEAGFELATVGMCMNGWFYALAAQLQSWFIEKGMQPDDARRLVLGSLRDCAEYAGHRQESSLDELAKSIATPGTYTARGQEILTQMHAALPWKEASDDVYNVLTVSEGTDLRNERLQRNDKVINPLKGA